MTIRYDQPADDLGGYITGYHVYTAEASTTPQVDWFLPGTANIRVTLDAGPVAVTIGRRTFDPLPQVALFGPTSTAMKATTHGGVMIGFGISALGWSRFTQRKAGDFRNRIVPAAEIVGQRFCDALVAALARSDRERQVAGVLDGLIRDRMAPPRADEPAIRRLMALIAQDEATDIVAAADMIGLPTHALRRLAVRHFGFPPKMLLMRARFLRSFLRLVEARDDADYSVIDKSYFDASHFLRDAGTFLGMTPRRFMTLDTPFLDASLRARAAVLGAATQALHDIGNDPVSSSAGDGDS